MTDLTSSTSADADASPVATKVCTKCGLEKPLSEFRTYKCSGNIRYHGSCKECMATDAHNKWAAKQIDPITGEPREVKRIRPKTSDPEVREQRKREGRAAYDKRDMERTRRQKSSYATSTEGRASKRNWVTKNMDNPVFALGMRARSRIRTAFAHHLKGKATKSYRSEELLGCTMEELAQWLEPKFTRGMNWTMFMEGKIHADHVKALASFNLADPDQQKLAFSYKNLAPLWAPDNLAKGDLNADQYVRPPWIQKQVDELIAESEFRFAIAKAA